MFNRTRPVLRDFCTAGRHWAPASEFHTVTRKSGRSARQSHCKACKRLAARTQRTEMRVEDARQFRAWRPPCGERHHHSKLTDAQRAEILQRWQEPSPSVARDYGITPGRVRQIWSGI